MTFRDLQMAPATVPQTNARERNSHIRAIDVLNWKAITETTELRFETAILLPVDANPWTQVE